MGHGPTWRSSCDSIGWHLFCSCLFMVHFPNRLALPLSTSAALSWVKLVLELRKRKGEMVIVLPKAADFGADEWKWVQSVKGCIQGSKSIPCTHFLSLHNKMVAGSCVDNAQRQHVIFYWLACTGILSNDKNQRLRYKVLELQPSHGSDCVSSLLFVLLKAPATFRGCLETNWQVAFQNSS